MSNAFQFSARRLLPLSLILSVAAFGCGDSGAKGGDAAKGAAGEVEIADFAFNPNQIEVKAGDKVSWVNQDTTPHTVTAEEGGSSADFDMTLDPEEVYAFTFKEPGTYSYVCKIHSQMNGKVVVE